MTDYDEMTPPKVVSVATTAEILDVSTRTVHRALSAGILKRVRLSPSLIRVSMASIEAWIEESTESPPAAS